MCPGQILMWILPPFMVRSEGGQAAVEQEEESEEEEDKEEQVQEEGSETAEQEEKKEWNMAACLELSFLGLFEKDLDKLAQNLNIFTFNGAHYDMVLLANYVASANGKFGRSYYRDWKILKKWLQCGHARPAFSSPSLSR